MRVVPIWRSHMNVIPIWQTYMVVKWGSLYVIWEFLDTSVVDPIRSELVDENEEELNALFARECLEVMFRTQS